MKSAIGPHFYADMATISFSPDQQSKLVKNVLCGIHPLFSGLFAQFRLTVRTVTGFICYLASSVPATHVILLL